ncbi:MAG: hypothetical protein KGQ60_00380 [Planctomycetes bacterium]|nr:hypothetical protein [Planctomycetota bacterium]
MTPHLFSLMAMAGAIVGTSVFLTTLMTLQVFVIPLVAVSLLPRLG